MFDAWHTRSWSLPDDELLTAVETQRQGWAVGAGDYGLAAPAV